MNQIIIHKGITVAKQKTFYQSQVSPEAYAEHEKRMESKAKERRQRKAEERGGDEGNIADSDIPQEILDVRQFAQENSEQQ